jgi:hypothetical protein
MNGSFNGVDWLMVFCKFDLILFDPQLILYRFGSAGIYGLGLPFMIRKMLNQYGFATTLRAYGVAIVCISAANIEQSLITCLSSYSSAPHFLYFVVALYARSTTEWGTKSILQYLKNQCSLQSRARMSFKALCSSYQASIYHASP